MLEHHPDIVLLDITMPEMNGFEAVRRIKHELLSDHELPATLILLMVSLRDTCAHQAVARHANVRAPLGS